MESKSTAKLSASENAPAFSEFELQHDTSGVNDAGVTLEVTNAALEQPVFVQGQPQVHYASKEHPDFSALVDQPSSEWRVVWDHPTQNGHFWHPHSDQTSLPNPTMPSGATWKVLYDLGERAWYFWNNSTGVSQWRNPHLTEDFLGEIGKEEQALLLSAAWPSEATLREHQHDSLDWRPMWDVVQQAWYFHSCASRKTQWANPSANAQAVWYPMWYCDGGKEMWFFHDPVKQVSQWENPYFQPPEVLATKLRGPEAEAAVEPLLSKIEREVVKLTKPTTPEDNISSEVAALADKKRKAIYEDRVKCSNALRSMVQGPGFCNEALLLFPGDSCRYGYDSFFLSPIPHENAASGKLQMTHPGLLERSLDTLLSPF